MSCCQGSSWAESPQIRDQAWGQRTGNQHLVEEGSHAPVILMTVWTLMLNGAYGFVNTSMCLEWVAPQPQGERGRGTDVQDLLTLSHVIACNETVPRCLLNSELFQGRSKLRAHGFP